MRKTIVVLTLSVMVGCFMLGCAEGGGAGARKSPWRTNLTPEERRDLARALVMSAASGVLVYMVDTGSLKPGQDLSILLHAPEGTEKTWKGPYLMHDQRPDKGLPAFLEAPDGAAKPWMGPYPKDYQFIDPWGNPLVLIVPGTHRPEFDVVSYGADGRPGGTGEDADIYPDTK